MFLKNSGRGIVGRLAGSCSRRVVAGALGLALLGAGGCQSMMGEKSASAGVDKVVVMSRGQSNVVYVPSSNGGVQMLTTSGGSVEKCAACEADAKKFYQTGQIEPVCAACGAKRSVMISPH